METNMKHRESVIKIIHDSNKPQHSKPKSKSTTTTSLLDRLADTYFTIYGIKTLINLILQCAYVQIQRYYSNQESTISENEYFYQIRKIMLLFGQAYRECNTSGVFYYSVHFYIWIVYYVLRKIPSGNYAKYLSNGGLLSYLENPAKEEEIISRRINTLIGNLIESNINFTRVIFNHQVETSIQQKFNQNQTIMFEYRKTIERVWSTSVRFKEISQASNKTACEITLYSLTSQLKHLNELKLDTTKVWPPNRIPEWADKIRGYWFKLYAISYANIWCVCTACVFLSTTLTRKSLLESNLADKNYTKFSLIDRFWLANVMIFCGIVVDWYITSLTVALISVYDQLKFVNCFEPKLYHLGLRMNKLDDIRKKFLSLSKDESFISICNFNCDKLVQNIKIECDNSVVEFYITFRLFRNDLKSTLQLTQETVSHSVTFITATLVTTLTFYYRVPNDQLIILLTGAIVAVISANFAFVLCAALHASSCRITNLIWPLITLAENCNLNYNNCTSKSKSRSKSIPNSKFRDEFNFDFEYYSNSLISPHTVLLLRKIVANHILLAHNGVCKLYGTIPLDYEGVVRINFLLISSILLALTFYSL